MVSTPQQGGELLIGCPDSRHPLDSPRWPRQRLEPATASNAVGTPAFSAAGVKL
jgi:hypothetical protein